MLPLEIYRPADSLLHRLDARVKMLVFFALVVSIVTADWRHPSRLGLSALLLGALLGMGRLSPGPILRRSLAALPFLAAPAVSAPFLHPADSSLSPWTMVAIVGIRSWLAAAALVALMACTRYTDLLEGAARLGVPRLLITLAAFLYRYLFVLAEESGRMLAARDLRGGGRGALRSGSRVAGAMVASLFLRTHDRGERIHRCMLARGFTGEATRVAPRALDAGDWTFLLLFTTAIAAAFLAG